MAEKHIEISFAPAWRRLLACLLLPALLLCRLSTAAWALPPATAPIPSLKAAAQDGAGTVWALPDDNNGYDQNQRGKVYRWQTGKQAARKQAPGNWVEQDIPDAAGFRSVAVAHGDDGSVYALWQKRDPGWYPGQAQAAPIPCLITVHRGIRSRIQSRFTAALPVPGPFSGPLKLYAGKGGDAWVLGDTPALLHIASDGTVQNFPVTPSQVFSGKLVPEVFPLPFGSSTDLLGRRWFWQTSNNPWEMGTLHGFLIWDGKTLAYHPTLPGLPDQVCSAIVPHGGHALWAVQVEALYTKNRSAHGGLYQIDTRTLAAVPAALPPKTARPAEAARNALPVTIERIFWIQGDLCVLEIDFSDAARLELWRRHGASWHKEPDILAQSQYNSGGSADLAPDAVLDTPQGTWLAVGGAGLDWLPVSGTGVDTAVMRVNWRRGLSAGRVSALFRLPDGNIMPFPYSGSSILHSLPPPLLPPRPGVTIGGPGQPTDIGNMLADQNRHLWGFTYLGSQRQALDEWDGRQWHTHPVPKIKSTDPSAALYACDTQGRIWIAIRLWNPPAQAQPVNGRLVYDPAHDSWTEYDTVPEALAAAASKLGMAFLPARNASYVPVFSGDGRVAYTDNQSAFLYDGKWRHWENRDIQPGYSYGNAPDHPQFTSEGAFEVALDTRLYDWTLESGWQPSGIAPPASALPPLPPGGPPGFFGQPVPDNTGGGWVNFGGDVYLTRYGLWRKEAAVSGRGSPFFDGRYLQNVLQGPDGRYFFETLPGGFDEYVVWSPPAVLLPAPRIQALPLSADSVRLRFQAARPGPHELQYELQWRLNGGAWSAPLTGGGTVALAALRPGTYRVEAQTINSLLQASPAPAVAVFTVQPPTAAQIAAWVQALLTGPDDAREAAVAGLRKLPAAALPALRAARPGASEAGQWWIDAAVQQLQYPEMPAAVQPE